MPLRIGETFAGYRVLRLLGSGGMGEVYLVQHPRLPRQEALKVLRPDISSDTSFRERFVREADLAAGLRHPNIVGVHDRGEDDGHLWIAMDYVEGTDLSRLLELRYPAGMPVGHVITITTAVAGALDYAHKKGLLHRDVKPANIIVADLDSDDPSVFLADFGIARPIDDTNGITTTNMTVGTVAYAAPEQLMGEQLDGRADQYALAATIYNLLTGLQLFPYSNPAVVISRHLNTTPPTLGDRRPDFAGIDSVLQRALAKSPSDRYPSCSTLAQALVDESRGQGQSSVNATTQAAPRTARHKPASVAPEATSSAPRSRRLWPVLACVAAIILLLAAAAVVWRPWTGQRSSIASTMQTTTSAPVPLSSSNADPSTPLSTAPAAPSASNTSSITATPSSVPALASQLTPFVGRWTTHVGILVIRQTGTGHFAYTDQRACPSCSSADAPTGTVDFTLTSITNDVATGTVDASSDEQNVTVGADITAMHIAGSPSGQIVQISTGRFDQLPFCDSTSSATNQCGA